MADAPFAPLKAARAPVIDGVLDDAVWRQAAPLSGFLTCVPDYGKPMLGDSKVYMAYDDENLYFAFRCYDPEPPKIKAAVSSRDNIFSDDWICINLDSFFDHQTAYGFYINPLGIQSDTRITTTSEDKAFDLVWYSAGRIDEEGYTIEVRIPTRSIRFSERDTVTMGVIFERAISRRNEQGTVPALNPAMGDAYSSWLMQMHPMVYPGLKHGTLLEMLPAVTYHDAYERAGADMRRTEHKTELGVTGKYGVTQDLILDGTYRPDFSQVESDAGQVDINLRHALIYPEKRPFFQEGSESFGLAATAASELDPVLAIVNTRTVLSPLAGAKVSGKIGEAGTVGAIYAADEMPDSESVAGGSYNHFAALRYRQSIGEDSYLGGLYTAFEQTGHHNRVAVADGQVRLTPSGLLEYDAMMSWTRPDPAASELSGHTVGLKYASVTRDLDYILTFRDIAEDFNAEMGGGYIARTGISQGRRSSGRSCTPRPSSSGGWIWRPSRVRRGTSSTACGRRSTTSRPRRTFGGPWSSRRSTPTPRRSSWAAASRPAGSTCSSRGSGRRTSSPASSTGAWGPSGTWPIPTRGPPTSSGRRRSISPPTS